MEHWRIRRTHGLPTLQQNQFKTAPSAPSHQFIKPPMRTDKEVYKHCCSWMDLTTINRGSGRAKRFSLAPNHTAPPATSIPSKLCLEPYSILSFLEPLVYSVSCGFHVSSRMHQFKPSFLIFLLSARQRRANASVVSSDSPWSWLRRLSTISSTRSRLPPKR